MIKNSMIRKQIYESSNILDISKKINFSFEFFPPKNNFLESNLLKTVRNLSILKPKFYSVTSSTNSTNRDIKTLDTVKKIKHITSGTVAAHLTCINRNVDELKEIAKNYWNSNINSIVALRGDTNLLSANQKRMFFASDLVCLLKQVADFDISVAAYPEVHPEALNAHSDLMNLKNKVDCGANRIITQFFFDTNKFLRFRDSCIKTGIDVDIIPGILPIFDINQIDKFASMTNVHIPEWIYSTFESLSHFDDNTVVSMIIGENIALKMVKTLFDEGVRNIHFYTLNRFEIFSAMYYSLSIDTFI